MCLEEFVSELWSEGLRRRLVEGSVDRPEGGEGLGGACICWCRGAIAHWCRSSITNWCRGVIAHWDWCFIHGGFRFIDWGRGLIHRCGCIIHWCGWVVCGCRGVIRWCCGLICWCCWMIAGNRLSLWDAISVNWLVLNVHW